MENPRAQVAALPIYRDGFEVGVLVGLRLALEAVDAERSQLAADHPDASRSPTAACVTFADGGLLAAMRVIAARFRQ